MNSKLLTKFALEGVKKSRRTVVPFLIAASLLVMIFSILYSMAFSPYLYYERHEAFYGAQTIAILLEMGAQIVSIFAAIFLVYANQFTMRDRRREIGLYGVLGLSRGHIAYILVVDMLIKAAISISVGLLLGTFLNKLMLVILYRVIRQPLVDGILFTPQAVSKTVFYFSVLFVICLVINIRSVNVGNPVELLRSDKMGEKEPKVKMLMLVTGVVTLAAGYYLALTCKSSGDALSAIVVSILLVICGTYCLFITGSIFLLKLLKKNKRFYYKTRNFISVSSLIYRMKHNAAGLASICVLSTGVILLLTCALSLNMLGEKNINQIFQADIKLEARETRADAGAYYQSALKEAADKADIEIKNERVVQFRSSLWRKEAAGYGPALPNDLYNMESSAYVYLMSLAEYNAQTGYAESLKEGEVLVYSSERERHGTIEILGESYHIAGTADHESMSAIKDSSMTLYEFLFVIFDSEETVRHILELDPMADDPGLYKIYAGADTEKTLSKEQMDLFAAAIQEQINNGQIGFDGSGNTDTCKLSFKQQEKQFFYSIYGGSFFVGLFLAVLFLMATVLIIYYKQMSEGYEDQRRYQILSYVGLTDKEARAVIKRQVMILFFLPVVTAALHMAVASNIVRLFLKLILVVDALTFNLAIGLVILVFTLVYALVYKVTSGQYYRIVNAQSREF